MTEETNFINNDTSNDIVFDNISYKITINKNDQKDILKDVSGHFKCKELTGVMGPSGSGKSTLLNILTGFRTSSTLGTIGNQKCTYQSKNKEFKKKSCYIQQEDFLCPLFTIQEIMMMTADLKYEHNKTKEEKLIIIKKLLESLLLNNSKDTRCGNLSGGEKKRLSIALELINNPSIIFLDEPTSGLDSSASYLCISLLKKLAIEGRTIICTIHQPSSLLFEMFDQIYVLAEGMCVYQGPSLNCIGFLKSFGLECPKYHNPADYLLEVVNCEYGNFNINFAECVRETYIKKSINYSENNNVYSKFDKTTQNTSKEKITRITKYISNKSFKFSVLLKKMTIKIHRDWTVTYLKLIAHIFCGLVLGLIFRNSGYEANRILSNIKFILIMVTYLIYTSIIPSVLRFPQEMLIVKKETFNNWYSLKMYYICTILCNLPMQVCYILIISVLTYFPTSQPPEVLRFIYFILPLFLITLIAESIGHMLGTYLDPVNGTFIGSIISCFQFLYSGVIILFLDMPKLLKPISYSSIFKYSIEAIVQSIYGYDRLPLYCSDAEIYCHYKYPSRILIELDMFNVSYWGNIRVLVAILIVSQFATFYLLKRRFKSDRTMRVLP